MTLFRLFQFAAVGVLLTPAAVAEPAQAINDAHGETRAVSARPDAPIKTAFQQLIDFAPAAGYDLSGASGAAIRVGRVERGGGTWLEVRTDLGENYPGFTLRAPDGSWDLRGRRSIAVDVVNLGDHRMELALGVRMPGGATDAQKRIWFSQDFEPHAVGTLTIDLCNTPWVLDPPLDLVGMRSAPGQSSIDLSQIVEIVPFLRTPEAPYHFLLGNLRAQGVLDVLDSSTFLPFIDRYGQFNKVDWPGKIHADEDFAAQLAAERADHAEHPGPAGRNRFGGWADGPQLEATGHFRVTKHRGKWWLVDPDGRLFWSHGVDCLDPRFGGTGVQAREGYFEGLPPVADLPDAVLRAGEAPGLAAHYGESGWAPHGFYADKLPFLTYDFYNANLQRKFGDGWLDDFARLAHARLKSWGMNTIASWGSPAVYGSRGADGGRTPYTAFVWVKGAPVIAGNSGYWGQFHDVFDPGFRTAVRRSIAEARTATHEAVDPWNIGFYVDNEIQWGDETQLALDVLTSPAEQAAKGALVRELKENHRDIAALNAAWGTQHASWSALLLSTSAPDPKRAGPDLQRFNRRLYDTYFRTIKEELRAYAPDKLYLGCRFAWQNDAVVRASARYCDVVSMNKYDYTVADLRLPADIDRPLIIGEFHFGAGDRGMFHPGLKPVADAAGRGDAYARYVGGALDNPQIVGTGWFQYMDQAASGRSDGENYNVGLVTTTDTPHAELIEGIRRVGYRMYQRRAADSAQDPAP